MMMIYRVTDKKAFKDQNLSNWYQNSEFWLQGKMRHLKDVYQTTAEIIREVIAGFPHRNRLRLVDFGCGEGWLLRLLREYEIDVDYVGVDFNAKFIDALKERYKGQAGIKFILFDLEEKLPNELIKSADIATNFFNFFEIPNLEVAVSNVSETIDEGGILIILTIDPIMQLLAVSETFEDFLNGLKEYENHQTEIGYDKDIDVGDYRSGKIYKSLLYSTATYVELAKKHGLKLFDYREVVKTGNFVPQIYEYILFRK
jgi:SAM-dependent methyltransferase